MPSPNDPAARAACPSAFNLAAHVLAAADRVPDKPAVLVVGADRRDSLTYGALAAAAGGIATGLRQSLGPGDRVLLRLGNTPDFPLVFLGAASAGCLPVATSAALTRSEITAIAHDLQPALIVADEGIALPDAACPVIGPGTLARWRGLDPCPPAATGADDAGYVLYTSGSSGRARGVLHAHRAIWARAMMRDAWQGLGPGDRLMHAGAFNWSYTLGVGLLDVWAAGATAVVPAIGTDVAALPDLMRRHGVTIFAAVPGVYRRLLRSPDLGIPSLRHGLSAGEALPVATRDAWRAATGTDLHEAFGLTECSTFVSGSPARPAPPGSFGFAQPGRRIAVLDAEGRPAAAGVAGTLAVHRSDPGLFLRYLDENPAATPVRSGDWFPTGDLAVTDAEGAFRSLGRADDMMNAGGNRVFPQEVEAVLAACPGVTEALVVEIAVRDDASVIAAAYVGSVASDALAAHAAQHLARYKQPRLYRCVDALPRTANGKYDRRALREEWMRAL